MLHVSNQQGRAMAPPVMRAMFAARKSVFVDLLKWDVPVLAGRYEIDQFDDEHATYIVLTDAVGGHLGSARLLPTVREHLLGGLYPFLCDGAVPTGETTFEITRFCLDRRLGATERRALRDTLIRALVDHAIAHGISRYTAIAEMGWLQQILAFGWRCVPLGIPQRIDRSLIAALSIAIDADTPRLLDASGISADPQILFHDELAAA